MFNNFDKEIFAQQKRFKELVKKGEENINSILEILLRKEDIVEINDFIYSEYFDIISSAQQRLVFQVLLELEKEGLK